MVGRFLMAPETSAAPLEKNTSFFPTHDGFSGASESFVSIMG